MALGEQHGLDQRAVDDQLRALNSSKTRNASTQELRYFKAHPGRGKGVGFWVRGSEGSVFFWGGGRDTTY